jgi:hypothetical protein
VRAKYRANVRGYAVRRVRDRYLAQLARHHFRAWHRAVTVAMRDVLHMERSEQWAGGFQKFAPFTTWLY